MERKAKTLQQSEKFDQIQNWWYSSRRGRRHTFFFVHFFFFFCQPNSELRSAFGLASLELG